MISTQYKIMFRASAYVSKGCSMTSFMTWTSYEHINLSLWSNLCTSMNWKRTPGDPIGQTSTKWGKHSSSVSSLNGDINPTELQSSRPEKCFHSDSSWSNHHNHSWPNTTEAHDLSTEIKTIQNISQTTGLIVISTQMSKTSMETITYRDYLIHQPARS